MSDFMLRPRFLPDRDAQREWGAKGASLARLIRQGFSVPPTAAFGLSQVAEWLEGLGGAGSWEPERLEAFQRAILSAPMPEHWPRSCETIRRLLCGEVDWPLILRPSMSAGGDRSGPLDRCFSWARVESAAPEPVWDAFRKVVAAAYAPEAIAKLREAGVSAGGFRAGVVVQPWLQAESAGTSRSDSPSPELALGRPSPELMANAGELRERTMLAERVAGRGLGVARARAELEWLWDGERLWYLQARALGATNYAPPPETRWQAFRRRLASLGERAP
jgi:hypothetical protein